MQHEEPSVLKKNNDNNHEEINLSQDDTFVSLPPSQTNNHNNNRSRSNSSSGGAFPISATIVECIDEDSNTIRANNNDYREQQSSLPPLGPYDYNTDKTAVQNSSNNNNKQKKKKKKQKDNTKVTPLPKGQMFAILILFLCEGFSYTFAFPFLGFMIIDFGLVKDEANAGLYAGFLAGSYSVAQFFSGFIYGFIADKASKKIVVLVSTIGCIITVLAFGFSPHFAVAIIARSCNGAMNGLSATVKAHLSDITDKTNQSLAFSILGMAWGLGAVGGPVIGGFLSKPVEKYPRVFGNSKLFKKFHYLLPCIFVALFMCVGFIASAIFLKNSPKKRRKPSGSTLSSTVSSSTTMANNNQKSINSPNTEGNFAHRFVDQSDFNSSFDSSSTPNSPMPLIPATDPTQVEDVNNLPEATDLEQNDASRFSKFFNSFTREAKDAYAIFYNKEVILTIALFFFSSLIDTYLEELFPLFAIITKEQGGLGFDTSMIGTVNMIVGGLMLTEPIIYPVLSRYLGALNGLRVGYLTIIPLVLVPQLTYLGFSDLILWIGVVYYAFVRAFAAFMTFTAVYIMTINAAPIGSAGRVMSVSTSAGCLAKIIAPFSAGPLLAGCARLARTKHVIFLNLPYLLCFILAMFALFLTLFLNKSLNLPKKEEIPEEEITPEMEAAREEDEDAVRRASTSLGAFRLSVST